MYNHSKILTLSAISLCNLSDAYAKDSIPSIELDPIVVTATRSPTKANNLVAQTRVINQKILNQYQGKTAIDVIKDQPGFHSFSYGGMGTSGNFYVRGYNSKNVLVLIDGIRYNSLSTSESSINLLPVEQIGHIEILYGTSGSSIYGSDAMGGVIQIFTKKNSSNALSINAGFGSHNHQTYGINGLYSKNGSTIQLSTNHNETKGINATTPDNQWSYHDDLDGFSSDNFNLGLHHQLNDKIKVGITGLYSKSFTEYDSGSMNNVYGRQKNGSAQAYLDWNYANDSDLKLQYGSSIDYLTSHDPYGGKFNSQQQQASAVINHHIPVGKITLGADYLKQNLDTIEYGNKDREISSIFYGYQFSDKYIDAQFNTRHDNNSQFGKVNTFNIGLAANLSDNIRLGGSYSKGFRAPSFNDLYYPGSGNLYIKPETSKNYEIFLEHSSGINDTRLTTYRNDIKDQISWVTDSPGSRSGKMKNFDKVQTAGINLTSDWFIDNYLFGIDYDFQKVQHQKTNKYIPVRPKHKGSLYAGYQTDSFDIRAEYNYVGNYYSDKKNKDQIKHYGLVNLIGSYYLTPKLTINTRINNLLNKDYTTWNGYSTDKTNVLVSVTYDY